MKIFAHLDPYLSSVSGAQIWMGQESRESQIEASGCIDRQREGAKEKQRSDKEEAFQLIKCIGQLNKAVSAAFP